MASPHRRKADTPGATPDSQPQFDTEGSLLLQGGTVTEEEADLLEELAGTHHHEGSTLIAASAAHGDDDAKFEEWKALPWWKRPSPFWMLGMVPLSAMAMSSTLAPKVELYITLVCREMQPDIFPGETLLGSLPPVTTHPFISSFLSGANTAPSSCVTDPNVQAAVAKLTAVITTVMGVLTLLTTAWWGSFSDRKGRVSVMQLSVLGLLATDFNNIAVYYLSKYLPGGYWFLIVGPVIEGILGGFSTAVAAIHAYLADTTTEANRARVFSRNLGLLFTGMALGPTLGALLIKYTGQIISVFISATALHCLYGLFIWFVLPESLTKKQMKNSRIQHERELNQIPDDASTSPGQALKYKLRALFQFLSPLAIFYPDFRSNSNPLKKPVRDWGLTWIAIGYGFAISLLASTTYTFQYAVKTYGWTSVQLGYYLSLASFGRALFLAVILPIIIKIFKPKPLIIEIPAQPRQSSTEDEPLLSDSGSPPNYTSGAQSQRPAESVRKELHSPSFELGVARASLGIEVASHALMGLAPNGIWFAAFGLSTALGAGLSPAVQTCALAMYARRGGTETGKLFGALSVVQALSSQVLGPPLYGFVFLKTVATLPRTIFFVAVGLLTLSLLALLLVRLPNDAELKRDILAAYSNGATGDREEESDVRDTP